MNRLAPELSTEFLLSILQELPLGVWVLEPVRDERGRIGDLRFVAVNEVGAATLRRDPDDLVGRRLLALHPAVRDVGLFERYAQALESGAPMRFEQLFPAARSLTGLDRWYAMRLRPFDGRLLVTFEDVSLQRRYQDHIKSIAFRDHLTGLYNRRWFLTRAPQLLALGARNGWEAALLYFDLNGFKAVNDSAGHAVGDELLRALARRLGPLHREEDILFRSGGDEFGLFLPDSSRAAALEVADRVAQAVDDPFEVRGRAHVVGVSIGVCAVPAAEADVDALLDCADQAMYEAKRRKPVMRAPISYGEFRAAP